MNKNKVKNFVNKAVKVNAFYPLVLATIVSFVVGRNFLVSPFVGVTAYFSWKIFVGDIKLRKIGNLDLFGLLASGLIIYLIISPFEFSIIRALVVFLIGWGMFQLFEGDIGGGDVRLLTVAGLFLNVVQLLAAVSLASAVGMVVASRFTIKRVPFGSLLIVAFWLSFWIVRF